MTVHPLTSTSVERNWGAFKIAALYLLIGSLWIVFTDQLAVVIAPDVATYTTLNTLKGWGYVIVTALLLYWLIRRDTAALRDSELRYRLLFENNPHPMWVYDLETLVFLAVNEAALQHFGYTRDEFLSMTIKDMRPPEDVPALLDDVAHTVAAMNRAGIWRHRTKDGTLIDVEITSHTLTFGGRAARVVSAHDVTERKRAEAASREREQTLSSIYNTVADVVFHLAVEPNGRYRFASVNQAFCSITGLNYDQVVGKRVDEIIPGPSLSMVLEKYAEAIRDRKIVRWEETSDYPTGRLTGEVSVAPVFDADGNCTHLVGAVHDITARKRAEAALRESRDALQTMVETSPLAIIVTDPQGIVTLWNRTAETTFGWSAAEAIGRPNPIVPPDKRDEVRQVRQWIVEGESMIEAETERVRKDGARIAVGFSASALRDAEGRVSSILAIVADITERKRAEEALRDSEERYRGLFEHMVEGYAYCQLIFENDQPVDWIYLTVNEAFGTLTGLKDVTGKRVSEVIPGIRETDPELFAIYARVALTGQHEKFEMFVEALQMWFAVSVYSPAKEFFIAVFDVITERKRAEAQLRESEQRFKTLFEIAPVGISVLDKERNLLAANDRLERITRITREGLQAGAYRSRTYLRADGTPMPYSEIPSVRVINENQPVYDVVNGILTEDGQVIWTRVSAAPLNLPDASVVVITQDITEYKQAEDEIRRLNQELEQRVIDRTAQLEAANKELEAFAYSVSHDLRAPLRAIDGFSRILLEDYGDRLDAEGRRLFGIVRTNAQQMDRLIIDLLALSRVTRSQLLASRLDMTTLVHTVYDELAAPDVQAQFTFTVASLPEADGDPTLLRQVWSNLISNAIKYTMPKAERRIDIGGYTQSDKNIYFVKDNGVGFNPDYAHKLFGIFQRLHKAEEFDGTGVGLAIVQRIVHRHGGQVWAEGQIGEGATFYFALPVTGEASS